MTSSTMAKALGLAAFAAMVCHCGPKTPTKYPARGEGCEVAVHNEAPPVPTENIGPVIVDCDPALADDECLRGLKDEVCNLGGDTVWGVEPSPTMEVGRKVFHGRAAHTR